MPSYPTSLKVDWEKRGMKNVINDCYCGGALDLSISFFHLTEKEAEEKILLPIFYHVHSTTKYWVIQENGVQDRLCERESTWRT